MVTSHPVRETREAAMIRLAGKARETGIKLYQDPTDGRFYASSRSNPGTLHYLTGFSCTCAGFITHQRCSHLAALHAALGWITTPEPTPPASTRCPACNGTGSECGTISTGRSWTYASVTCATCHGTGTAADTAA